MQDWTPALNTTKLVAAYSFYIERNEHYSQHKHPHHELVVIQRGRLRVHVSDQKYLACPGDILLYPREMIHEEWAEDNEPVLTWACVFQSDGITSPLICHDSEGRVQELMSKLTWLFLISRYPRFGEPAACLPVLQAILTELDRLTDQSPQTMIQRVRGYILAHIAEPFTLDDLSAVSGLSKYHFVRHYRSITGRTPMEDARVLRVTQAYHLVEGTLLPLHEIGALVGIPDPFHLSRLLKAMFGMSPSHLRHHGGSSGQD